MGTSGKSNLTVSVTCYLRCLDLRPPKFTQQQMPVSGILPKNMPENEYESKY
jgi:hypothetical protein